MPSQQLATGKTYTFRLPRGGPVVVRASQVTIVMDRRGPHEPMKRVFEIRNPDGDLWLRLWPEDIHSMEITAP